VEYFTRFTAKLSTYLDRAAGWLMVSVMLLVVSNVLSGGILNSPILGTYEYVGFITAMFIGLSIAYCALQDFHIAVGFLLEKLPPRIQRIVDVLTGTVSLVFLSLTAWHIANYARSMVITGEVSPTTRTPFYPFIYVVAFGFLVLSLVVLSKLIESIRKVVKE